MARMSSSQVVRSRAGLWLLQTRPLYRKSLQVPLEMASHGWNAQVGLNASKLRGLLVVHEVGDAAQAELIALDAEPGDDPVRPQ
jgi:hypothetical protein